MINGQRVLAIIPARGGSKRVPRKNLREFRGKPLVCHAIHEAAHSQHADMIVVSTDDADIKHICAQECVVYIDRPAELATDTASSEDVMRHAASLYPADWYVLLQPTSPLRTTEDIDACIERAQLGQGCISVAFSTGKTNGAVYVCTAEYLAKHDFVYGALMKYVMPDDRSLDIDTEEDFQR